MSRRDVGLSHVPAPLVFADLWSQAWKQIPAGHGVEAAP
jgi:hypothetical protein